MYKITRDMITRIYIISEEEVIAETTNSFFSETVETLGIEENQWIMNHTPALLAPIDNKLKRFDRHP